jgi:hypothetical protein|tara:strand:- start:220 stop:654 length:435 start_codon:yes stop_codon:yes gene_type:complete
MPKFKVTATMDVGYTAVIEADNEDEAWAIARGDRISDPDWEQTDNGHDWTLENIWEVKDNEVSQAANPEERLAKAVEDIMEECEQGQMGAGKNKLIDQLLDERIVEYVKTNDPKPVPVQKHKVNPSRNPFASETQSIKGHKSRK